MKYLHLSPPTPDFSSELQSQLRLINHNILYITHEVDKIYKLLNDLKLQTQVDDFYQGKNETSPQTDSDEQ